MTITYAYDGVHGSGTSFGGKVNVPKFIFPYVIHCSKQTPEQATPTQSPTHMQVVRSVSFSAFHSTELIAGRGTSAVAAFHQLL